MPGPVRRTVVAACGLALLGGLAEPAGAADTGHAPADQVALDGLPLPDRPVGGPRGLPDSAEALVGPAVRARTDPTVRVRPGDSLWSLAAADLPPAAHDADVLRHVRRLHQLNRDRIGPDPDLVHPGQRLRLPRPRPALEQR